SSAAWWLASAFSCIAWSISTYISHRMLFCSFSWPTWQPRRWRLRFRCPLPDARAIEIPQITDWIEPCRCIIDGGVIYLMQPVRLGALVSFCASAVLLVSLVLPPSSGAQQAVLETPQQVNDRIRSMSAAARVMPHDYVIGNGDLLDLEVFDVKEL